MSVYRVTLKCENRCELCSERQIYAQCDRCGESVCNSEPSCGMIFPHHYNTEFVVCKTCVADIEAKLKPVINIEELRLLKRRIATRKQR